MNPETVAKLCGELTLLKFFPADDGARRALFKMVGRMASNEDQVKWLVRRTLDLCDEWPGPKTFRAIFCKRYKPMDDIDLRTATSEKFPEGIPDEPMPPAPRLSLAAGAEKMTEIEMAESTDETIKALALAMPRMPSARYPMDAEALRFAKLLEATITAPRDREEEKKK